MKNNNKKTNGTSRLQIRFCYYDGLLKHAWASQGGETAGAKGSVSADKDVVSATSAASVGVTTSAKAEAKAKGVASATFEVEHELAAE